ncbi:hypothetical protein Pcinc_009036 [Petrolisthes cinctipes]|uniref:Uncharacterized protein n=1 Tax=Petrolisthes cinctipes TaxID=88211 RepID=A0AAE1G7L5_PETCI|nr:hypothetical protein Pcinc_009036 [Petrolisthes cinctipes]
MEEQQESSPIPMEEQQEVCPAPTKINKRPSSAGTPLTALRRSSRICHKSSLTSLLSERTRPALKRSIRIRNRVSEVGDPRQSPKLAPKPRNQRSFPHCLSPMRQWGSALASRVTEVEITGSDTVAAASSSPTLGT